jgi:hypothetical protein
MYSLSGNTRRIAEGEASHSGGGAGGTEAQAERNRKATDAGKKRKQL